jgi:hypothetical protein
MDLKKQDMNLWIWFICLRIGPIGGLMWTR